MLFRLRPHGTLRATDGADGKHGTLEALWIMQTSERSSLTRTLATISKAAGRNSSRPEDDRERRKAAQHQAIAARPGQLVPPGGEPQARVTAEQFLEGHPGFEPGQGRAQAVVDPVPEPQVRPVTAADVEDVR